MHADVIALQSRYPEWETFAEDFYRPADLGYVQYVVDTLMILGVPETEIRVYPDINRKITVMAVPGIKQIYCDFDFRTGMAKIRHRTTGSWFSTQVRVSHDADVVYQCLQSLIALPDHDIYACYDLMKRHTGSRMTVKVFLGYKKAPQYARANQNATPTGS